MAVSRYPDRDLRWDEEGLLGFVAIEVYETSVFHQAVSDIVNHFGFESSREYLTSMNDGADPFSAFRKEPIDG